MARTEQSDRYLSFTGPEPVLIVMSGLAGSGKSTIAEAIGRVRGCPVLSVDPIESAIVGSGITRSFETSLAA